MFMTIPVYLRDIIDYTIEFVDGASNNWFRIKSHIANQFPSKERSRFSRRHYSTKKHILNSFDREVIKYWETKTGTKLWIDPEKLHPEDWEQKPRGWRLFEINDERRQLKKKTKETD